MNHDEEPQSERHEDLGSRNLPLDELLSAYVDGELTGPELAKVELRLQQDLEAREWVAEVQQLSRLMQSLPRQSLDPDLCKQVLRQVTQEQALSAGNQPASLGSASTPSILAEPRLRRWLWPGLAIAAALLLMFLQPDQPQAERRLADAQHESKGARSEEEKVGSEGQAAKGEEGEVRMVEQEVMVRSRPSANGMILPASGELADTLGLAEESQLLARDSVESVPLVVPSPAKIPASDLAPTLGAAARLPSGHSSHLAKTKSALARSAEWDLVVQVILSDQQQDGRSFRALLTERGMKPLKAVGLSSLSGEHSPGGEEKFYQPLEMRDRSQLALLGDLVDTVVVETLPEQLRSLLNACRVNPDLQSQYHLKQVDGRQRLSLFKNTQGTDQLPIRIKFELRHAPPVEKIKKARSGRPVE